MNNLPKGWEWTRLGKICKIVLGQSPPSSTYNSEKIGLPFYQGKSEFGEMYPSPVKWCSKPKKIAEKGDVLISVRAPVGPTNICPEKSCIGRGLAAIRPLGDIKSLFILYLMRNFEQKLADKGTGTTFKAITGDRLKEFSVPLPPLPEQHRIVAKIEELFTNLDAGVEALKKVKVQLNRYRQSVLKYAFEGKLTADWRQRMLNDELKMLNENSTFKTNEEFNIQNSKLKKLPERWVWTKLGEVLLSKKGKKTQKTCLKTE